MMLVRRFVFYSAVDWQKFIAFMKANLAPMAAQERWLQAVVSEYKTSRSLEQNAYMWVGILEPVAEQYWAAGRRYSAEVWNEQFKEEFLPDVCARGIDKWQYLPKGDRRLMMSTSDLNKAEMTLYLQQIAAYAATELGVHLPANPRDL